MKKRRIAAGLLAGVLVIGGQQVWAATTHYNDSSVTGAEVGSRLEPDSYRFYKGIINTWRRSFRTEFCMVQ